MIANSYDVTTFNAKVQQISDRWRPWTLHRFFIELLSRGMLTMLEHTFAHYFLVTISFKTMFDWLLDIYALILVKYI